MEPTTILWAIGGAIALVILVKYLTADEVPEFVYSRWHHYFPELQFSTQDFYTHVEEILKSRNIPDITITRTVFSEKGVFSKKREYLRVRNSPYSFDICAAPYGAGFFVSWWFGEDMGCLMRLLMYIPLLGTYLKLRMMYKTYYRMDTETMFQEAVRLAVLEAIDAMTTTKGVRMLTEMERQPKSVRK